MQHVEISHNPFTVETGILFDGKPPDRNSPLAAYETQRLQFWVENLFEELQKAYNGAKDFELSFTGAEADWLDVEEAAEKARAEGMNVVLKHGEFARNGETLLKELIALKEEAEAQGFLDLQDSNFQETFRKALDKDFNVFVVATLSSGKSTLINAILGQDLLPAANDACTATIAEIRDNDAMPDGVFKASCENQDGEQLGESKAVTKELLEAWNRSGNDTDDPKKRVFRIKLEGNIQGIQERGHVRLVLTDTPSPNSQTEEHVRTTIASIQDERKQPLIVYVLNGTQLGIDDDRRLLELVSEHMSKGGKQGKDRFLFVVNKMDAFDPERERIPDSLENVRAYLEHNGIEHPQVYPVSARLAYLLRKKVFVDKHMGELTKKDRSSLHVLQILFDAEEKTSDMDMEQYMPLTGRVKQKLDARGLDPLLRRSGVPALECVIDEYIDRYCYPYRVKHAYDALTRAIEKANHKERLTTQLDQDERALQQIEKAAMTEMITVRADKEKREAAITLPRWAWPHSQLAAEKEKIRAAIAEAREQLEKIHHFEKELKACLALPSKTDQGTVMQHIELHLAPAGNRILLNGNPPAANTPLARLMEYPLEILTGKLFDELRATFNGARRFTVRCAASEAAFARLSDAAEAARAAGMKITLQPLAPASAAAPRASGASSLSHRPEGPHAMLHIEITHNPFTVKTVIKVEGASPVANSPLAAYENQRLQFWVEKLFEELQKAYNGAKDFELTFTGVESDWLDVQEAAAKAKGMKIVLKHGDFADDGEKQHGDFADDGEKRLKKLIALKEKAEAQGFLNLQDSDFKETFQKAMDKDFDVFVVATMSSGKSTLINAILGQDLLPAINQASTATIAEIRDNDTMPDGVFKASCENQDGEQLAESQAVTKELLEAWNKSGNETDDDKRKLVDALAETKELLEELRKSWNNNKTDDTKNKLADALAKTRKLLEAWNKNGNEMDDTKNKLTKVLASLESWNKRGNETDNAKKQLDADLKVTEELLRSLKEKLVYKIKLEGNIQGIQERAHVRLRLTDTPGPNNSQTKAHEKTTMASIQDERKQPLIVYVLNGTQLGTDDDKRLLGLVSDKMSKGGKQGKDRFLFVANKMDAFDPDSEDISGALKKNVRNYLEKNGIEHPQVYPVSARLAYLLRKKAFAEKHMGKLTLGEKSYLDGLKGLFDVEKEETKDMNMEQYMPLTRRVTEKLDARGLDPLLRRSGIPALESIIDEYIDKYCFPYRVKHAYDALTGAIEKATHKERLTTQLDLDTKALEQTRAAVAELRVKEERSFDVEAYKEKLERGDKALPDAVEVRLVEIHQERMPVMRELKRELRGEVSPSEARQVLGKAEKELGFLQTKLVNAYESEFKQAQEEIRADLREEYKAYVQSLFPESGDLKLPVLESIKQSLGDISLDLSVRDEDVQEETRAVKRAWYNPARWFGDKYDYEKTGREYVDLGDRWEEASTGVESEFADLLKKAREQIQSGHIRIVEEYIAFMSQQFEKHFNELMADLKTKLSDQKQREAAIAEARKQLEKINRFEKELEKTLAL